MARVSPYYSINEAKKPAGKQVYHTDDNCRAGRDIPKNERRTGEGGYRHCDDMRVLADISSLAPSCANPFLSGRSSPTKGPWVTVFGMPNTLRRFAQEGHFLMRWKVLATLSEGRKQKVVLSASVGKS